MLSLRFPVGAGAAAVVLALPAFAAGPPTTFPATYDATSQIKETVHATAGGRTITRRFTFESAGPLTFVDDRTMSIDSGDDAIPDFTAKYETDRKGVVRFRISRESQRPVARYFRRMMREEGFRGASGASFGVGRIEFSEDGSSLDGKLAMRLWFDGSYRGVGVEMNAVARFTFSGTRVP